MFATKLKCLSLFQVLCVANRKITRQVFLFDGRIHGMFIFYFLIICGLQCVRISKFLSDAFLSTAAG